MVIIKKIKEQLIKDNILMQDFSAEMKNKIWVGDIAYIPTKEGFLYLMAYMDVYTRKIVGWSMDKKAIFEYIELFYNRKRRHSSIGYLSPIEYEKLNLNK